MEFRTQDGPGPEWSLNPHLAFAQAGEARETGIRIPETGGGEYRNAETGDRRS
jgi:hypothetical protein